MTIQKISNSKRQIWRRKI